MFLWDCQDENSELLAEPLKSPYGQVYIQNTELQNGGRVGLASLHFEEDGPYISYKTAPADCCFKGNDIF